MNARTKFLASLRRIGHHDPQGLERDLANLAARHGDGAEVFNAFNTPWLAAAKLKNAISSSSFGTIPRSTSQNGEQLISNREIQLGFWVIF